MKNTLSSKDIRRVLSGSGQFKTKNISFRYLVSSSSAIAFSINKQKGSAVLRNKFKRRSRSIFLGSSFKPFSLHVLVRPLRALSGHNFVLGDFSLFKKHLETSFQ